MDREKMLIAIGAGTLGFMTAWIIIKNIKNNKNEKFGYLSHHLSGNGPIPCYGPYKEFSVIYTDRTVNLMSPIFIDSMLDISRILKQVYKARSVIIIPGSGTFGMESVARYFGTNQKVLILRNGYFSFRWSDIFQVTGIALDEQILCAQAIENHKFPSFAPHLIDDVVQKIKSYKPAIVFAPHVETATGMIIPNSYLKQVSEAVHLVGGLFCLDCIASGNVWVDMKKIGVDILISAPQKGWTGPACCGLVMLSEKARMQMDQEGPKINSFCCNLKKWLTVMENYEGGGFMYYTTLPTDSLMRFRDVLLETKRFGFDYCQDKTWELGNKIRSILEENGFKSVSAKAYQSPGVVVSYSPYENMVGNFKANGIQIAGGVPFKLGEDNLDIDAQRQCFRVGLFGLDKLRNISQIIETFSNALQNIIISNNSE